MGPKFGKKSPMNVAGLSRSAAQALIEREERRVGSRMVAYENVAQTVGASAEWLRKFIGPNYDAKEPKMTLGFNIMTVYRRVCERVEQAADSERQLREEIDAALESAGLVVERATAEDRGTTEIAPACGGQPEC